MKNLQLINWRNIETLLSTFSGKQRPHLKKPLKIHSLVKKKLWDFNMNKLHELGNNLNWTDQFGVVKYSFYTNIHDSLIHRPILVKKINILIILFLNLRNLYPIWKITSISINQIICHYFLNSKTPSFTLSKNTTKITFVHSQLRNQTINSRINNIIQHQYHICS